MASGSSPSTIRAVLFDLGSTLWHHTDQATWEALEAEANLRAVATLRALLPSRTLPTLADDAFGATLRTLIEASIKHQHQVTPDEEPPFARIAAGALRTLGVSQADKTLGARVFEALRVRAAGSRVLYADSLNTLAALSARGLLLGIVTNRHYGGPAFLADLRQMDLLAFIAPEHIAISADLGYRKPHPALYRYVLERLHVVPTEAAMVGDNLIADVYGAQQLGLFTVWRPRPVYWSALTANAERARRALAQEPPGDTESERRRASDLQSDASRDALLFALAQRRAQARDQRASGMAPPNAIVKEIGDVLRIFHHDGDAPLVSSGQV